MVIRDSSKSQLHRLRSVLAAADAQALRIQFFLWCWISLILLVPSSGRFEAEAAPIQSSWTLDVNFVTSWGLGAGLRGNRDFIYGANATNLTVSAISISSTAGLVIDIGLMTWLAVTGGNGGSLGAIPVPAGESIRVNVVVENCTFDAEGYLWIFNYTGAMKYLPPSAATVGLPSPPLWISVTVRNCTFLNATLVVADAVCDGDRSRNECNLILTGNLFQRSNLDQYNVVRNFRPFTTMNLGAIASPTLHSVAIGPLCQHTTVIYQNIFLWSNISSYWYSRVMMFGDWLLVAGGSSKLLRFTSIEDFLTSNRLQNYSNGFPPPPPPPSLLSSSPLANSPFGAFNMSAQAILDISRNSIQFSGEAAQGNLGILLDFRSTTLISIWNGSVVQIAHNNFEAIGTAKFAAVSTSTLGARTVVEGLGSTFITWNNSIQVSTTLYAAYGILWSTYLDLSVGGKWLCVENSFNLYSESGQTNAMQMPTSLAILGPGRAAQPPTDTFSSLRRSNAFSSLSPLGTAFNVSWNVVNSTCNKSTACGSSFEVWRLDVAGWEDFSAPPAEPFLSTCDTAGFDAVNGCTAGYVGATLEENINGVLINDNTITMFCRQSDAAGILLLSNGIIATGGTQIIGGLSSPGGVSKLVVSLSRNIITIDAGLSSVGISVARALTFGRESWLLVERNIIWMRPATPTLFPSSAFSALMFGGPLSFRNGSSALLNDNKIQSTGRSGIGLNLKGFDLKNQSTLVIADNAINATQSCIAVSYQSSQAIDVGTCVLVTRNSLLAVDYVVGQPTGFQFYSGLLLANGSIFSVERNSIWASSTRAGLGIDFSGVLIMSGPPGFTARVPPLLLGATSLAAGHSFAAAAPSPVMRIRLNNITSDAAGASVAIRLTLTLVENQAQLIVSDNIMQALAELACAVGINLLGGGDTAIPILFRAGAQLIVHRNTFYMRSFQNIGNCGVCAGSAFGTNYLGRFQFEDRSSFFFCANTVNGTAIRVHATCMNRLVVNLESIVSIDSNRANMSVVQDRAAMSLFLTELHVSNSSLLNINANNATIYDGGFTGFTQTAFLVLVDTTGTTAVNISRGGSFSVKNNILNTLDIRSEAYLVQLNYFNFFFGASWIVSGNSLNVFCRQVQPATWVELVTVTTVSVGVSNSTIAVTNNALTSTCTISSGVNFAQGLRLTQGSSFYLMQNRLKRPLAFKDVNFKLVKLGSNNQGLIVDDSTGVLNAQFSPLQLSRLTFQCNYLNDSSLSTFDGDLQFMLPAIVGLPGPFSYFFDCNGKLLSTPGGTSGSDPRISNDALCGLIAPSRCDSFGSIAIAASSATTFSPTICTCSCRDAVTMRVESLQMIALSFSRTSAPQCTPTLTGQPLAPLASSRFSATSGSLGESTSLCSNPNPGYSKTASHTTTVSPTCSISNQTNSAPPKNNNTVNTTTSAPSSGGGNGTNSSSNASTLAPTTISNTTAIPSSGGTTNVPAGLSTPSPPFPNSPPPTNDPSSNISANATTPAPQSGRPSRTITVSHLQQPGKEKGSPRSSGGVVSMATQSEVVSRSVMAVGSAGAALGGLVGNPALAGQAIRISSVTGSVYCLFSDTDDTPSLLEQPFQTSIGSGPLPYYVGSTLLTSVVFLCVPWLVHGVLRVVARRYTTEPPRWLRLLQGKVVSNLALVSLSYMGPSIVKGSVLVLGHSSEPLDLALMAACLCAVLVTVGVVFWVAIPSGVGRYEVRYTAGGEGNTGKRKPELVGMRSAPMFVESFGLVIDAAREPEQRAMRIYLCVDLAVSMGLMVLDGVRPVSGSCAPIAGTMLALCLLHLLYLGLVRPMRSKLEQLFSTLGALILVVLALLALTLTLNDSAGLVQAFGVLALLDSGLFFVEAVVLGFWAYTVRQRRLTRNRQALVDTMDDADPLRGGHSLLEVPLKEKTTPFTPVAAEGCGGAAEGASVKSHQRYNPLWQS